MGALVACAVVRDDPPRASSPRTSTRSTGCWPAGWWPPRPGRELPPGERAALRQALREERWGDAVFAFIARTGVAVDVYESTELHVAAEAAVGPLELQLTPLFTRLNGDAGRCRDRTLPGQSIAVTPWQDASMPSDRTTVTELGTGLGMLGLPDIDEAVRSRTPGDAQPVARDVGTPGPPACRRCLRRASSMPPGRTGRPSSRAADGLRGRPPNVVEWKGTGRAPGDEVAPIDLRVDHVYLVSCKYLSTILFNVSPSHVFDELLAGGPARAGRAARGLLPGGGDWYAEVAPAEHQALYEAVRARRDAVGGWSAARQGRPGAACRPAGAGRWPVPRRGRTARARRGRCPRPRRDDP